MTDFNTVQSSVKHVNRRRPYVFQSSKNFFEVVFKFYKKEFRIGVNEDEVRHLLKKKKKHNVTEHISGVNYGRYYQL